MQTHGWFSKALGWNGRSQTQKVTYCLTPSRPDIRPVVVGSGGGGKGQEGIWGKMELFCVWIVVLLQDHVKAHLTVCLKRVNFTVSKSYLNEPHTYTHSGGCPKLPGIKAVGESREWPLGPHLCYTWRFCGKRVCKKIHAAKNIWKDWIMSVGDSWGFLREQCSVGFSLYLTTRQKPEGGKEGYIYIGIEGIYIYLLWENPQSVFSPWIWVSLRALFSSTLRSRGLEAIYLCQPVPASWQGPLGVSRCKAARPLFSSNPHPMGFPGPHSRGSLAIKGLWKVWHACEAGWINRPWSCGLAPRARQLSCVHLRHTHCAGPSVGWQPPFLQSPHLVLAFPRTSQFWAPVLKVFLFMKTIRICWVTLGLNEINPEYPLEGLMLKS